MEKLVNEIEVGQSAMLIEERSSTDKNDKLTEKSTLPDKLNAEKVETTDIVDRESIIKEKFNSDEDGLENDDGSFNDEESCADGSFNNEESCADGSFNNEESCADGSYNGESSFSDGGSYCSDEESTDNDDDSANEYITRNDGKEQVSSGKVSGTKNDEKKMEDCEELSKEKPEAQDGEITSVKICSSEKQSEKKEEIVPAVPKKESTEKRDGAPNKPTYAEITAAKRQSVEHETKRIIEKEPTGNKLINEVKFSSKNTKKNHRTSKNKSEIRASTPIKKEVSTSSEMEASNSSKNGASTSSETGESNSNENGASTSSEKTSHIPCEKDAATASDENTSRSINEIESSFLKERTSNSSMNRSVCDRPSGGLQLPSVLPRPPCHDGKPGTFCRELMAINESQVWMDQMQELFEVMLPEYQKLHASLVEGFVRTAQCQGLRNTGGSEFKRLIGALRANVNAFMIQPLEKFTLEYAIKVQGHHDRKDEATIEAEVAAAKSSPSFVLPEIKCKNIKGVNKDVTLELGATNDDDACLVDLLQDAMDDES